MAKILNEILKKYPALSLIKPPRAKLVGNSISG